MLGFCFVYLSIAEPARTTIGSRKLICDEFWSVHGSHGVASCALTNPRFEWCSQFDGSISDVRGLTYVSFNCGASPHHEKLENICLDKFWLVYGSHGVASCALALIYAHLWITSRGSGITWAAPGYFPR